MAMDKQSGQAVFTIKTTFRKDSLVLYAGILVLTVSLMVNHAVAADTDSSTAESTVAEEAIEGLSDDLESQHVGMYSAGLSAAWEEGLREKGLEEGANERDIYIASGRHTVNFPIDHPGFHESRSIAYDVAYLKAKAQMVRFLGLAIEKNSSLEVLENARWSDGQGEALERLKQVDRIKKKMQDFGEAQLDQELAKLDPTYDPDKYGSREQKEEAARDVFRRQIATVASSFVSGALPMEVLEGPTQDGKSYEILVGLVWSPRLELAARAIAGGYAPASTGKAGVSVSDWLPKRKDSISASWGVHKLIDENGDQVFVGFGQAAPRRASPSRRARAEDMALSRAEVRAIGAIRGFVGETVRSERADEGEETATEYADAAFSGEIKNDFTEKLKSNATALNLEGLTVVGRWVVPHPANGQKVAVVAVSWSPTGLATAKQVREVMSNPNRASSRKDASEEEATEPTPRLLRRENIQMEDF